MAIDTKSLTQLITEFRKLQAKDSITPESLGYILQRIADLLATAGTSDTVEKLQTLLNGFNTAGRAIVSIAQGKSDRNHVYANINYVSLVDGHTAASNDNLFIQQATTERAGAMRAQQVIDLNAARKGISTLEQGLAEANKIIDALAAKLGLDGGKGVYTNAQITCTIRNGVLHVLGAQNLISNGYVPYLFRPVRKRNPYKDKDATPEQRAEKKYCTPTKGWGVFGSLYAVRVQGTEVQFSINGHAHLHQKAAGYSNLPSFLVSKHTNKNGDITFGWGRSSVNLTDTHNAKAKKQRMIRLRFGIGFAKPIYPGRAKITPANLASSLAEFSVIYNPATKSWHFGK